MLVFNNVDQPAYDVGVIAGYVVVFVEIGGKIVEMWLAGFDDEFPVAFPYPYLVGFIKFPIKERMRFLPGLI